jgi:hypothetical protein
MVLKNRLLTIVLYDGSLLMLLRLLSIGRVEMARGNSIHIPGIKTVRVAVPEMMAESVRKQILAFKADYLSKMAAVDAAVGSAIPKQGVADAANI